MRTRIGACGWLLVGWVAVLGLVTPASGSCPPGTSNPVQHALGGRFEGCPDLNPVAAFIYTLGDFGGANSATVDVICEDAATLGGQFTPCPPEAGQPGDGSVTVSFDYGNPGAHPGCPNPALIANPARQIIHVVADHSSSLLVTVAWSVDLAQYGVDFAQQDTFPPQPLFCDRNNSGFRVLSFSDSTLVADMFAPRLNSDCDPGTWGSTGGGIITPTCKPEITPVPTMSAGRLHYRFGQCTTFPNPILSLGWSFLAAPDASGRVSTVVPRPDLAGMCTYVGASGMLDGAETPAVFGSVQFYDQISPAPGALDVMARRAGGEVAVSWRTVSEIGLAGFEILADARGREPRIRVDDGMIPARGDPGGAGFSYEIRIPVHRLQGARALFIQSILSTGESLLSDPASF